MPRYYILGDLLAFSLTLVAMYSLGFIAWLVLYLFV